MKRSSREVRPRYLAGLMAVALLAGCEKPPPPAPEPPVCETPGIPELERQPLTPRPASARPEADIREQLEAIPGLTVLEDVRLEAFRFLTLDFEQPADHLNPQGERFLQRMTLMHRSQSAPMVLDTEGAGLFTEPIPSEPADLLQANQLTVEHRFFGTSRPASGDWKLLTVEQAAADAHRVVEAFKPLYDGRWLSTGVFKGGTAAILHRFFYPDDVHATIPYAAEHSRSLTDERYGSFLARVGDESCRQRLQALQRAALERREELLPFLDAKADEGAHFEVLGRDRTFEFAVVELPFTFWRLYGMVGWSCDSLPAPDAPARELFDFVDYVADLSFTFSDEGLELTAPVYYQQATQLGAPLYPEEHLRPLLRYPGEHVATTYPPRGVEKRFDGQTLARVEEWMRTDAQRMLLVHGEYNPWTASAFDVNVCHQSYRVIASESIGFFGTLAALPETSRDFVFDRLSDWAGVPVHEPAPSGISPMLHPRAR